MSVLQLVAHTVTIYRNPYQIINLPGKQTRPGKADASMSCQRDKFLRLYRMLFALLGLSSVLPFAIGSAAKVPRERGECYEIH